MLLIYLPLEILINITEFLFTKDILNLAICSKHFHYIPSFVKFNEKIKFKNISKLPYFDSFTNVIFDESGKPFPKSLRILDWLCNDHLPLQLPMFGLKPSLRYAQQRSCPAFGCLNCY